VNPVTHKVMVGRPRTEIFDYLSDIANLSEFADHFFKEWRLTREDSVGRGAGARFKARTRLSRFGWLDLTYTTVESPHRIVAEGHGGKDNKTLYRAEWELRSVGANRTEVAVTIDSQPTRLVNRIGESFGARRWVRHNTKRSMRRLQAILEDGERRGQRISVAAG
jgi:hypothetical protein